MDSAVNDPDYSDFEYQQFVTTIEIQPDETRNPEYNVDIEPLGTIGGLSNNEVAELVYFEMVVTVELEHEVGDELTDAAQIEHRGIFGANIDTVSGMVGLSDQREDEITDDGVVAATFETAKDEIFQLYHAQGYAASDGQGGSSDDGHYEKDWRSLTGRGPVLDSTDKLNLSGRLIADAIGNQTNGSIRLHMVWDVAEVSDAGRAFSVPSDD